MVPTHYPRRILLAVTGLSPQVVTETLYALAANRHDPWVPTEVHLITTKEGAERVRHALLNPEHGHFHRLCREYDLPTIHFGMENVWVIRDDMDGLLEDIRSEADNRRCADTITQTVRDLTADPMASLHASIAGGRKTMGYYLGYAISLYGRSQDRLSHVLVNAPYESHPDFYYPTKHSQLIHTRGEQPRAYDTKEAQVSLAEIPFVRMREGLPPSLMNGASSFSATVAAAQSALGPLQLVIDLAGRCLSVSGVVIEDIAPAELAFYSWMARRRCEGSDPIRYDDDGPGIATAFLAEYRRIVGEFSADYEQAEQSFSRGMGKEEFDSKMSRTNAALKKNLPPQLFEPYRIASSGKRPETRYGLSLPPEAIRYASVEADASD